MGFRLQNPHSYNHDCFFAVFICCISSFTALGATGENIDEDRKIDDISIFDGKKIGVVTGTTFVDKAEEYIKDPDLHYYKNTADSITALKAGKVDAVLGDTACLDYYASETGDTVCKAFDAHKDEFGVIAGKTAEGGKLINEFNDFLAEYKSSGELESIQKKWFTGDGSGRKMKDYSSLPATNGTVTVGTDAAYPPLEYLKNNCVIGYEMELVGEFCREYGYRPDVKVLDFDGIIAGVSIGKYDLGASAFTITEERKKSVLFTDAIYENYGGVLYNDSIDTEHNIVGKAVSGFKKTFIEEDRWKSFVSGIAVTLEITVLSIMFGTILGFLVHLVCRRGRKATNKVSAFARWIVQGMPQVVMLMIAYYIIFGNSSISGSAVAVIVFSVCFACSMHNLLESGENGLDPGQKRAAVAMGYSEMQSFFKIILPQAARRFLPEYMNSITVLLKGTAVVGYIAVLDITKVGDIIRGTTYEAFFPLISVAVLYFAIDAILRLAVKILMRRLSFEKRNEKKILKGVIVR